MTPPIWVRLGDAGSYEKFEDIDEVIEHMQECGVGVPLGTCDFGLYATGGFEGLNYISIYHGHAAEKPLSPITDDEYEAIREALSKDQES